MNPTCDVCGNTYTNPAGCPREHPQAGPCRRCWEAGTTHGACDCEVLDRRLAQRHKAEVDRLAAEGMRGYPHVVTAQTDGRILSASAVDFHGNLLGPVLLAMSRRLVEVGVHSEGADLSAEFVIQCCQEAAEAVRQEFHRQGEAQWWWVKRTWLNLPVVQTAPRGTGWRVCRLDAGPPACRSSIALDDPGGGRVRCCLPTGHQGGHVGPDGGYRWPADVGEE